MSQHKAFRKISIGGLTTDTLIRRLGDSGIQFNEYSKDLFKHKSFSPPQEIKEVSLFKMTATDLQLNSPCSLQTIINQASHFGLKPCPLYLGAFLRLDYTSQPEGPYLTIASFPPEQGDEFPTGFYIRNFNRALWLRGYRAIGDCDWPQENEFIFMR